MDLIMPEERLCFTKFVDYGDIVDVKMIVCVGFCDSFQ